MSASVQVEKPATLYRLTNKDLYRLYQEDVQSYVMVIQNLARELSRRLRKAEQRICEMAEEMDESDTTQI